MFRGSASKFELYQKSHTGSSLTARCLGGGSQTSTHANTSTFVQSVYSCMTPEQKLGKPQQHSCIPASTTTPRKKRSRNGNKKKERKARGVTFSAGRIRSAATRLLTFWHLGVLSLLAHC